MRKSPEMENTFAAARPVGITEAQCITVPNEVVTRRTETFRVGSINCTFSPQESKRAVHTTTACRQQSRTRGQIATNTVRDAAKVWDEVFNNGVIEQRYPDCHHHACTTIVYNNTVTGGDTR